MPILLCSLPTFAGIVLQSRDGAGADGGGGSGGVVGVEPEDVGGVIGTTGSTGGGAAGVVAPSPVVELLAGRAGGAGGVVGRDGVVEGERVAGALADAARELADRGAAGADGAAADPLLPAGAVAAAEEPDEGDRLELEGAPLRSDGALLLRAEEPVSSGAGSAAGLSLRGEERKPRGSSRSPPIASGEKVRSALGTMASDRDAGAAAPPPEVSRSSAGNG